VTNFHENVITLYLIAEARSFPEARPHDLEIAFRRDLACFAQRDKKNTATGLTVARTPSTNPV
jgi:hypothetical protein